MFFQFSSTGLDFSFSIISRNGFLIDGSIGPKKKIASVLRKLSMALSRFLLKVTVKITKANAKKTNTSAYSFGSRMMRDE